ncbi:hypothetical protein BUALT_Bualt02G0125100 [Buddleja alternifolia]|uniref:Protein kinase domain-containing protein n=1 Tax=Buddleja alternifolia TaxID=168488 RepID=A0AAV6Y3V9_9LAMI|nr:hypothetical protein BUALT_Bualt02G0125100 [Buddleja alternifolia]
MAINYVLGPSIFFCVFLVIFPITYSFSDSEALLRLKQSFTNAAVLDSWKPETEPCGKNKWIGVTCENGVVFGLRLGNLGLSGNIDVDALVSISGLRSVSFMSNAFSGPIPDFNRMGSLKGLYLSGNEFSGEIPSDYFSKMVGLKKVWLSRNNFSGTIPSSLVHLSHVMDLHLEDNRFSGTIPPFNQPSLISLDLSNNNLEGEIPSVLLKFSVMGAFKGNPGLCGGNLDRACDPSAISSDEPVKRDNNRRNDVKIAIWVLAGSAVVFLVMAAAIYVMKRRQESSDAMVDNESSVGKKDFELGPAEFVSSLKTRSGKGVGDIVMVNDENGAFGLEDLMKASAEVIGNGALGSTYKAIMDNGLIVVVKRIKEATKIGKDHFDAEMQRFGGLKHKNVMTPLAYHFRKDEKLLVYEYQPKGSDCGISHAELNWPARFRIVQGIARGLGYLHNELPSLDLPHGDLKSSNVLLTPEYEPLLVDYGYCSLISSNQAAQVLTGYKSPEAMLNRQLSPKCDVFCLGIIILEILTGKFPSQYGDGGIDLVQWVRSAIDEEIEAGLFDPDITRANYSIGEMEKLLHIGVACTESNPEIRLDIREAIKRIDDIQVDDTKAFGVVSLSRDGYGAQSRAANQPRASNHYNDHSGGRRDSVEDQPAGR